MEQSQQDLAQINESCAKKVKREYKQQYFSNRYTEFFKKNFENEKKILSEKLIKDFI